NLSLDYYNIEIEDRIAAVGIGAMIECLAVGSVIPCAPGVSMLDAAVFTPAFTGDPSLGLGIARNAAGVIVGGQRGFVNRGTVETDGMDFNIRTNFAFGGWGSIQNQLQLGYVNDYSVDGGINQVGRAGVPEIRANLGTMWTYGDFNVVWNISYIDGTTSVNGQRVTPVAGQALTLPSWTTHDLQVNYHTPWNGRLTVGVD